MIDSIKRNIINLLGWKTNRKIIVFESDDWGSIRMQSKKAYKSLLDKGYPVSDCAYSANDALEGSKDLEILADLLNDNRDHKDNPAIFTLNMISGNPDYEKIRQSSYSNYYWEPFYKTLEKYPQHDKVIDIYKEAINKKIFKPQLHGREHINISRWMYYLQKGEKRSLDAFEFQTLALPLVKKTNGRRDFLDSFGLNEENNTDSFEKIVNESLEVFYKTWNFYPTTFMAPCYTWPVSLETILKNNNISGIQGTHVQRIPDSTKENKVKRAYHYMGQKNIRNQYYFVRNVFFEPTENPNADNINNALNEIKTAFFYKKPAIIQTHRLNYIGFINENNREKNIKELNKLLKAILKEYPDVEFMSTDQVLNLMNN